MNSLTHCLLLVSALILSSCASTTSETSSTPPSPSEALARLKDGNARAVNGHLKDPKTSDALRTELAKGQQPFAVILGCADSRVGPEIVFDQPLGNLFVCRVAGNVTDPEVAGSIEYAVEHLHSPLIVVLGHSECGAVKAALSGGVVEGNLGTLLRRVHTGSVPKDEDGKLNAAIRNNVASQCQLLKQTSPVIRKAVSSGKVQIVGGVYSLKTGEVTWQ